MAPLSKLACGLLVSHLVPPCSAARSSVEVQGDKVWCASADSAPKLVDREECFGIGSFIVNAPEEAKLAGADTNPLDSSTKKVGLENGGNTCYIAAAHQVLLHAPDSIKFLLDSKNVETGKENPIPVVKAFAKYYVLAQEKKLTCYSEEPCIPSDQMGMLRMEYQQLGGNIAMAAEGDDSGMGDAAELIQSLMNSYKLSEYSPMRVLRKDARIFAGVHEPESATDKQEAAKDLNEFVEKMKQVPDAATMITVGGFYTDGADEDGWYEPARVEEQPTAVPMLSFPPEVSMAAMMEASDNDNGGWGRPTSNSEPAMKFSELWKPVPAEGSSDFRIVVPGDDLLSLDKFKVLIATKMKEKTTFEIPMSTSEVIVGVQRTVYTDSGNIGNNVRMVTYEVVEKDGQVWIDPEFSDHDHFELAGCAANNFIHWWAFAKVEGDWYKFDDDRVTKIGSDKKAHEQIATSKQETQGCTKANTLLFRRRPTK